MNTQLYDHLDESEQLSYIDGELDPSELEGIEQHLSECVECQDAVDDLAAASDGLTAFLNQSDYQARPMVYHGVKRRGFWINPWAAAAAVAMLFGGVAVPRMLMAPPQPGWVTGAPAEFGRAIRFYSEVDRFIVEFSSRQASGTLQLTFEDTDLFTYRNNRVSATSTMVDPDIGLMEIKTSAEADTDHELTVPLELAAKITIRVAGETVPFDGASVGMSGLVQIDLAARGSTR